MSDASQNMVKRFLAVMDEHKGLVYKVCYMYAEDADHLKDLYQEVAANIWQGLPGFRGEARLSTWIYRIAINTCVSFMRHNGRDASTSSLGDDACRVADDSYEHSERLKAMYELIGLLGKLDKALIMLWLDEFSYDEIAAMTGLTRNNVATRLHRIRNRLIESSGRI